MSQPVLFLIDNDTGVVRALRDDRALRFGQDFRIIGGSSAAELHEPVAPLIAGHHLSGMPT